MKLGKVGIMGLVAGIIIAVVDLVFFYNDRIFMFLLGIAVVVAVMPFMLRLFRQTREEEEISDRFLEFSRNLAESVATGTPISKSVVNISKKNYGVLNPYITKMANQVGLGIPVHVALENFARDIDNKVITRAVSLIREAEKAGGEIDFILDSVAKSIAEIEKLKKERKAAIFNLIVQGYIIFFIFIGIMLVMEFKILPLTYGLQLAEGGIFSGGGIPGLGSGVSGASAGVAPEEISRMFLLLLVTQGFFAGLTIGKLSQGSLKAGIKHSFILTVAAFLISTGVRAIVY